MKRLTKRNSVGVAIYKTPYACGNCNETLYRLPDYGNGSPTDKLADYEDAEENGMLIHLPCRVGDTVYRIWNCGKSGRSIAEFKIEHIDIDNYPQIECSYRCNKGSHSFYSYRFCKIEDFGKTVFLTREDAEQALKQMGE